MMMTTTTLSNDAQHWIVQYLQLKPPTPLELTVKGADCLNVHQLELLMAAIRPHMSSEVRSPSGKEDFVKVVEQALLAPDLARDLLVVLANSSNVDQQPVDSDGTISSSDENGEGPQQTMNDDNKGSRFRQAFGKAMLKMMGSRLDRKMRRSGRQSTTKSNNAPLRARTQSHDGYISSDDEGGGGSTDDGGTDGVQHEGAVRHSSLIVHPPLNGGDASSGVDHIEEYTMTLNDSNRGARPRRDSSHARRGEQSRPLNDSSHHSSAMSDVSSDDQIANRSHDGYASSDDENFMNDIAHKSLPGDGYAISDDGSVDSFG
eukprot:CAMPEP_0119014424 /NCGR_PEP_ID=MMETSP1176-20130426/9708_1 /TAXON_ID=265551 /ORGANISM="Synedropsis recta cf, Strain CCMP1620" /LENGTH=316 /DNA_ID=CAMNT_0006967601 /DNA_START=60 /DNA_END=1010 /DNA_ORIENTATION=-